MAKKAKISVKSLSLTICLAFTTAIAYGLDFPHVPSNPILPDIGCLSCHDLHGSAGSLLKASVPNPDMGGDNTEANNLCWSCHTGPALAPYRVPHSSDQISQKHGIWNIECKDCHNPHNQPQIQTFGSAAFLATGTLTSVTSSANSTLTDSTANWTVDEHAGRVVFPDTTARDRRGVPIGDLSYRILSNTATTLTLDGVVNTAYIAAGDTYGIVYGKIIRNQILVPGTSTWKEVKFFSNTGTNSFADDDATLDGVCQVCHTKTGHFRNDGTGPDQMHTNADRGDLTGTAGENCTEKCHLHIGGFGHGKGNTDVTLCIECHGHEEGTIYDPDGTFPYKPNGSTLTSRGFGSVIPHTTHTESWHTSGATWETTQPAGAGDDDLRGPGIYCSWCHDTTDMPHFRKDGSFAADDVNSDGYVSLEETSVCNDCHSPGGDYNGVNSVDGSVGAKDNWHSEGIYDADYNFKPGKEKWCAGCHDKDPSHIVIPERGIDITAPKIVGDEEAEFRYGVGWGFYKTGHGTPSSTTIPASGGIKNGPGLSCTYCHQSIRTHIDGEHRTFDCSDGCDSAEYSASYRMRKFSGSEPMQMPRPEDGGIDPTDFDLCLRSGCHGDAQDSFIDAGNMETNFRNTTTNLHQYHLNFYSASYTRADWSTSGAYDNRLTCIVCHNPHGTVNHSMIRTGELTNRTPINIYYWDSTINLPSYVMPPNPENITLGASDMSIFEGTSVEPYCSTHCHGSINQVDRTPFQNTDLPPILKWSEFSDYQADGAAPDVAAAGTAFKFMVQYLDYGNDAPTNVFLWVDADDDGVYEDIASEKFTMSPIDVTPVYVAGVHYAATVTLGKAGDNILKYKFTASDVHGAATGEPTGDSTLQILNALPTLDWTQEDERYSSDGLHPDNGANGGTYQFRIKYTDVDGSDGCPASGSSNIQVWIDLNDANGYEAGEKFNMLQVDGDADCTDGKLYYYDAVLTNVGTHNYRFYASDGFGSAYGDPATTDSSITVAADANTVPVLSWVSESCFVDGVKPPNGANGTNSTQFEFKIKYTDEDNQCPTGGGSADIQVWIDEDKSGTYSAGEKHNLSPVDGDADCTTSGGGKLYNITGLTLAANQDIPFEFHASDGVATDNAIGDPVTTGATVDVYSAKTVKASGGDYTTIQGAVAALAGNTTLLVDPGSYGSVAFQHDADHNWTIISTCGADQTTITGGAADAVYIANGLNTVIDGFTLTGTTETDEHGITTNGGSLTLKNSKIHSNAGNGAYFQTTVTLENVEIYNNSSRGIYTNGGTHNFTNLIVRNNTGNGGGIYWGNLAAPATLTNVIIKDNSSTGAGGGMFTNGAYTVNVTNCTITGNVATSVGGGWYMNSGIGNLTNCIIANNSASSDGGGFQMNGGTLTLNNSTIADNSTATDGGAIDAASATITITNSILWDNVSAQGDGHAIYGSGAGSVVIMDSIVQNDWDGDYIDRPSMDGYMPMFSASGFLTEDDPAFVDEGNLDYRLNATSVAIDNAGAGASATDRDGNTRTNPDIGAYEYISDGVTGSIPTVAWTGETNFVADGVNPDSAIGGTSFEFRVDYTDPEGAAPVSIELWIDEDHDGVVETSEKHAMSAVGGGGQYGDGDHSNGERYSVSLVLTKPGGGDMTYRVVASDGALTAVGDPANSNIVNVGNRVPTVAWPGDTNYETDGVHPDVADSGDSFTFRVMYTDADNTAPIISQVWIDINDTMFYDSGEYFDMAAESGAGQYHDGDYTNGEYFTFTKAITKVGDGRLYYRFAFSDGVDDATGAPSSQALASERYSRVFTVNDFKTTGVSADATPASETTVNVAMVYTGDENNDNSLKVEYGVTPADTNGWTTFATATHPTSPYSPTITGLTSGESYDVKMTFTDADGVLGTVSSTDTFVMPIYAITPGTATATVATENSILVTMPYTNDGNNDSTYTVKYRVNSPQGAWVDSGTNPKANAPSPATHTITGLTYSETYDVQVTYNDPDGGGATQVITGVVLPTVYTVCPDAPATCPVSSIQAAIDLATSGDTVLVFAVGSPYSENILMDADDDGVTVKSDSGFGSVTIQGATSSTDQPVVKFTTGITASTVLDGFTIDNQTQGGNDSSGILINGGASPTVKNTIVAGNTVDAYNSNEAGGISITQGGLTLQDSLIGSTTSGGGNNGEFSGGIYATTTSGGPYSLTISNSTIRYNTTTQYGGGIYESGFNGTFDIDDSVIANNTGATSGGGFYLYGPNLTSVDIANSTINNNSVTNNGGGGIYARVPLTISGSTITANQIAASNYGGGIYLTTATSSLVMTNSQVTNHTVSGPGAGIYSASSTNADPLDISNSTISGNRSGSNAGGIYMSYLTNAAKLTNVEVSNNTANNGDGGGLYIYFSDATITNSTISSNSSTSDGGGVNVWGNTSIVDITDSTISNNTNSGGYGGGLYAYSSADVTITSSTISGNTGRYGAGLGTNYSSILNVNKSYIKGNHALDGGGGLYNNKTSGISTTTLTSTIMSGNTAGDVASENAWGGAIYNLSRLYIYSSTLMGNYAEGGAGGIFFNSNDSDTDIENSIIWSNDSPVNGSSYDIAITSTPTLTVNYSNFASWDPADGVGNVGNIDADPQVVLADLAALNTPKTGGDYRLQSASPSVDTGGGSNVPADDIEGEARPYDGDGDTTATVDMGADEMTTGNQAPTLDWEGSANYTADGVNPDSASSGSAFTFKVKYTDLDNHPPGTIYVWVDADNSGTFEDPGERTTLTVAGGEDGNYANGEIYETNPALTLTTVGNLDYKFEASDGWLAATGSPTAVRTVQVSNTVPATPTNSTPADTATNIELSPTLTGSAFVDTDPGSSHLHSQWQIDDDSGFGSVDYDTGAVTDLVSHAVGTPLNASTTYYWRVRYRDNLSAWSSYSSGTSFTTTSAPNTPTNSSPADTATGVTITPTLTASAYSDPNSDAHQSSQWQVDDNADFSSVTYDSGAVSDLTSHTLGSSLGEGVVYYWRVRYLDAKGAWSSYSTGTSFTTNQKPNTPSNSTPADTATDISITPTLTGSGFSDPDGGDTHAASQWQVDDNADFSSITYDSGSVGDLTSHTLGSSLGGVTTYYWRVRYQDNNGDWSSYSTSTSFTTQSNPPDTPTNVTPADTATGVEVTPTLVGSTFSDVDPGDTHAASQWQVDDNSDFSSITYDSGEVTDLESRIVEIPLAGSTTYYWRVRYKDNNANWSNYSTGTSFTTETSPYYVCSGETPPYDKIQTTIADAGTVSGDKIIVCAGSYAEKVDFLGKNITVKSISGAGSTTITGNNTNAAVVNFTNSETTSAVLDGFTLNNVYHNGSLSRGIYIVGAEPTVKNTIIEDTVMVSYADGAAAYINGGGAAISNTTIRNNTARMGAGMYVTGAVNLSISNSAIEDNSSTSVGTVRLTGLSGTVDITDSSVSSNTALGTGGIYLATVNTNTVGLSLTDTLIDNNSQTNTASYDGGGLYVDSTGTVTVQNITLDITNGSISNNSSRNGGGARILDGVDLTITGTTINNNWADASGGGLYVGGTLTTFNLSKCTVAGNDADSYGGGIYTTVTTNITNCMITGNHAYDPGITYSYGGGVYATGTANFYNSTVVGNYTSAYGGGIRFGSGEVRNSIVWGNTTGMNYPNIYGNPTVSYSNVGDSQYTYAGSNGNINEPPIMVNRTSASQSSPTDQGDFRLCRGLEDPVVACTTSNISPSIDTGTYDAAWTPAVDYAGQSRPYDVSGIDDGTNDYDMGADEYHP